jgi:hypothetical protein
MDILEFAFACFFALTWFIAFIVLCVGCSHLGSLSRTLHNLDLQLYEVRKLLGKEQE